MCVCWRQGWETGKQAGSQHTHCLANNFRLLKPEVLNHGLWIVGWCIIFSSDCLCVYVYMWCWWWWEWWWGTCDSSSQRHLIIAKVYECLLCMSDCFADINSFNPGNNSIRWVLTLGQLFRWENSAQRAEAQGLEVRKPSRSERGLV